MDGHRFDDLARLFAQSTSRRTVWRSAFGLAAGWFGTRPGKDVDAQDQCVPLSGSCTEAARCCGTPDVDCCTGVCTPIHDALNCGSCGNACDEASQCCGDACIPLTDPTNCGGCGVTCGPCQVCSDVAGTATCVSACTATQGCVDGVCTECPAGMTGCGGTCVDLQTDYNNCGGCGSSCDNYYLPLDGLGCFAGTCQCPPGMEECEEGSDFYCTSCCYTRGENCCPEGQVPCEIFEPDCCSCEPGEAVCFNNCVNIVTNDNNCGACDVRCHAGTSCIDGTCQAVSGESQTPTPPAPTTSTPTPTSGEPVPAPTSSDGAIAFPSTGTGARRTPAHHDGLPLLGAGAALGAAAAWFRRRGGWRTDA